MRGRERTLSIYGPSGTRQIVDALLKALSLCACSQGTMNNVVFGNDRFSYYETVGGGCGATQSCTESWPLW